MTEPAGCYYCASGLTPEALVCAACGRDVSLPASLLAERDQLHAIRDRLKTDLAEAQARLAALRRRERRSA